MILYKSKHLNHPGIKEACFQYQIQTVLNLENHNFLLFSIEVKGM